MSLCIHSPFIPLHLSSRRIKAQSLRQPFELIPICPYCTYPHGISHLSNKKLMSASCVALTPRWSSRVRTSNPPGVMTRVSFVEENGTTWYAVKAQTSSSSSSEERKTETEPLVSWPI